MFERLFEPGAIGGLELKNRLVMAPMVTNYCDQKGRVTQRLIDYYAERARGGVGMVIVEAACVEEGGRTFLSQLALHDDSSIPGLNSLARAVKEGGAKACIQIQHGGRRAAPAVTRKQLVAPSPLAAYGGEEPRELSVEEIVGLEDAFEEGARRACEAGFELVEVHGTHGYLIAQFLSPYTNRRTDEYGGGVEGRCRFPVNVLHRIKQRLGPSFPVTIRLSGDEYLPGGLTPNDSVEISRYFEAAGYDGIHISACGQASSQQDYLNQPAIAVPPHLLPKGCFAHLAGAVKRAVRIPVIAVGRISDPATAERILAQGQADLVALARPLLADPAFPRKILEGRHPEIRECIACNRGCIDRIRLGLDVRCTVNPEVGRETEFAPTPTPHPKRVAVVGGGPAGLEAAVVAARRGHRVTLFERRGELGGRLRDASLTQTRPELEAFLRYLIGELERVGVEVEVGVEVNAETVRRGGFEVVVVATGATPRPPPGLLGGGRVLDEGEALGVERPANPVVVLGGGFSGVELALTLTRKGGRVTLVTRWGGVGENMESTLRKLLLRKLRNEGVEILTRTEARRSDEGGVVVVEEGGSEKRLEAGTVVYAGGFKPEASLLRKLEGGVPVYAVGDCVKPRGLLDAVAMGAEMGLKI